MPKRDNLHEIVKQALAGDGWQITEDPFVISFGERFLFIDLGAEEIPENEKPAGHFVGAEIDGVQIVVEIKQFRGQSAIVDLERAIGQYILYQLLLDQVAPERQIFLAVTEIDYDEIFSEPIGDLVINELPLQLVVIDSQKNEVLQWIPQRPIEKS